MDGRPKAVYDPFLAPTMPPIPPIGAGGGQQQPLLPGDVDPKAYAAMIGRDSSLPSINSLMRVPTTTASPVGTYNPHLAAAQQQQQHLGMYQPYSTLPSTVGPMPGYQAGPVPLPAPLGAPAAAVASSTLLPIPAASESPQIYDLDKNFHLNAPVPQYPPVVPAGAEIPPPGYGGHYHQRPPMYGNYHPTSSYNYNDDYYLASTYNNYTDYTNPMGYQPVIPAAAGVAGVDPHATVLQPLGQQVPQLQPLATSQQQPPMSAMVTTLSSGNGQQSMPEEAVEGGGAGKKGGSTGSSGSDKKAEKKPTQSSMARYVCSHCDGKEFVSLPVISKHIRQHNLVLCNLCVRTFETTDELKSHECRPKGSNVSYPKCPICLKYLSNSWSLSRHMKTHNRDQSGGGGGGSKDLSSSSDIKSSESEESSNAKLDLEGSAMDCDDLSKDMAMSSRGAGDDMELELDGGESMGSQHHMHNHLNHHQQQHGSQDMMLKSPRVMVEKLSFPHFNHSTNSNSNHHSSNKSETGRLDTSSSGSECGKTTDDEGLVDERTKKEDQLATDVPLEKCIVCGKEFKNRTYLYKHLKSVHTAKILKAPLEDVSGSQPGSPVGMSMKHGHLDDILDNGNAPVKSSVARALASKLSNNKKQQQLLNGKSDEAVDPLSTDSNNNGSNGGDYLVPLTSANANQININTSGNSITIISNVTYCNTAHEVPITTSTTSGGGPGVGGPPVTTAGEDVMSSHEQMGGVTTLAGSNGTNSSGLGLDGRRLSSSSSGDGKMTLVKQEVKDEGHAYKVEGEGMMMDIKQEPDHLLQQEDVLDKMGNKLLEPPPFIIQKVKQDVVVVTGSETTIVQPNLIDSDAMMGKTSGQYENHHSQGSVTTESNSGMAVVKDEPQDPFGASKPQSEDPYAFHVDGMDSHFGNMNENRNGNGPSQQHQTSQSPQIQQQPGNGSQQMHSSAVAGAFEQQQQQTHQMQSSSNPSQLDQNHTSQQQQSNNNINNNGSNFYGGGPPVPPPQQQQHHLSSEPPANMQQQQLQPQMQPYMNAPPPHHQQQLQPQPHPHMVQGYDPMKMYPDQPTSHHMVTSNNNINSNSSGSAVPPPITTIGSEGGYPNPNSTSTPYHLQQQHPLGGVGLPPLTHSLSTESMSGMHPHQLQPQQPPLQVSQMDQMPSSVGHLDTNPSSQQTSIDNSADFDGETGGDGEQESFQSGGDGGDGDNEPKTQICDECGKSFAKRSQLTRHKNIHKNIIYICPFCQREPFKARNSLKNHLKTNHKDMKDKWEDPAYISAQVIKEPEKVDEYMRNWNEKTKPGMNAKGGAKGEEKHPVDMLESMSNSMQMGGGPVASEPPAATPKGKKKKGSKAKGAAAVDPAVVEAELKPQNGPPVKVEPIGGAPDYYNGAPAGAAPMHPQHYGGHNPYSNAYQPPYMGLGQQGPGGMGEYGQLPPPAGMEHHLMQQQSQQPPGPPHHHQLGGPQGGVGGLYQAPGGYQGQHMMAPGGSHGQSPYGQPYPPPPPPGGAGQQHGHGLGPGGPQPPPSVNSGGPSTGPGAGSSGSSAGGQQYGGHHGKSSNSVPASPLRSSLQSPMSPPVSPHPQQFYQHQLPPGHHYYGAGAGTGPGGQPAPLNPYRSTSGLSSRQSPAPFSPHVQQQQPQRTQSTDSASSAISGSAGGGGASASGSALVTNQYGSTAGGTGPYHPHHHQLQQQQPQQQQYQPPHQYGPPQGAPQAPSPYGQGATGTTGNPSNPTGGSGSSSVGPIPPTPPPSASSFSSNASTSSTSSNSSAYGQQQSSTPSLHHPQHHHTGQSAYHSSAYDGQQPPPSKRPRYYPPGGATGAHPTPPPPQPQQQQQQPNHHHVQQQQQYYGAHNHHLPPNGAGGAGGGMGGVPGSALSHHTHYQMYNGMQPPPPSSGPPSAGSQGQNMGAPGGYQ